MNETAKRLRRELYGMGKTEALRLMDACGLTEDERRKIILCHIERIGVSVAAYRLNT